MARPDLPGRVANQLGARFGQPRDVQRLGGLSGTLVFRVRFATCSAVLKYAASSVEQHVYRQLGARFRTDEIHLPHLLADGEDAGVGWLLIEDIPAPLPVERRLADPQLLAMLRRLHHHEIEPELIPAGHYQAHWDDEMTAAACSLFPGGGAALRPTLERMRARAQPLFEPAGLLSGDPNPLNWGLRADGSLVLFDWERITFGAPALDVAITVPGLGSRAAFEQVAIGYWRTAAPAQLESRVTDLRAAKAWTVVELLSHLAADPDPGSELLTWMQGVFPDWLHHWRG